MELLFSFSFLSECQREKQSIARMGIAGTLPGFQTVLRFIWGRSGQSNESVLCES
jgi:hypothetical protein